MDLAQPRRVEHQQTDKGYVPVYTTALVEQPWDTYSADDHATWSTLYQRQRELLVGRACQEFLDAQDEMGMSAHMIPRFDQLNEVLGAATGWTLQVDQLDATGPGLHLAQILDPGRPEPPAAAPDHHRSTTPKEDTP